MKLRDKINQAKRRNSVTFISSSNVNLNLSNSSNAKISNKKYSVSPRKDL